MKRPRPANVCVIERLFLTLCVTLLFPAAIAVAQTTGNQGALASEIQYYYGVRTIVDLPLHELAQQFPELEGLQPAESQDALRFVLEDVGFNVKTFFRNLPNTTSIEEVRQQRLNSSGKVTDSDAQKFHYLVLTDAEKNGATATEYRVDTKGRAIEPRLLKGGLSLLTEGFAASSAYFDPSFQSGSDFRYLGRQDLDGYHTYVVAFAQRPQTARILSRLESQSGALRSAVILVQGLAWIDERSLQIVRLRTVLLKSREDIGLNRESTRIKFAPVHFTKASTELWLPEEVIVTLEWRGKTYRNVHRYSNYKLFTVGTEQRQERGEPTATIPEEPKEPQEKTPPTQQAEQIHLLPPSPAAGVAPTPNVPAQVTGPIPEPRVSTIKVEVKQVLVPVIVTDQKGHYVTDLKLGDFQVLEDGVPQQVLALNTEQDAAHLFEPISPDLQQPPTVTLDVTPLEGVPVESTYVVCIDTLNSSFESFSQVRSALRELFKSEKSDTAEYALVAVGRTPSIIQNLTKDPATVLSAIGNKELDKSILYSETANHRQQESRLTEMLQEYCRKCPCLTGQDPDMGGNPTCSGLWQNVEGWAASEAQERSFQSIQFLRDLRTIVRQMGAIPGRRVFILISDGFNLQPGHELFNLLAAYTGDPGVALRNSAANLEPELEFLLQTASGRSVTFYTLDCRGLVASATGAYDATDDYRPTRTTATVMPEMQLQGSSGNENQDVLRRLADATGGTFYGNSNDLLKGMRKAFADGRVYYVLAYASKNKNADGKFRRIEIRVRGRRMEVRAKEGYWAPGPASYLMEQRQR